MKRLLVVFLGLLSACAIERIGTPPFDNDLYFPAGVVAHPNGRYAYVVSANSDLRYNAGTVAMVDLDALDPANEWNQQAIVAERTQRIDAFGAMPTLNSDASRLFVSTRNNAIVYAMDLDAEGNLSCGDPSNTLSRFTTCDADHAFQLNGNLFAEDLDAADTSEPWLSAVATPLPGLPSEYLFMSHLGAGAVSVYDITRNSVNNPLGFAAVALLGAQGTESNGAASLGARVDSISAISVLAVPGRDPWIYAGSSALLAAQPPLFSSTLFFFEPKIALGRVGTAGVIPLNNFLGGGQASIDVKYIVSSPDGNRTYLLTREPNALVVLDTSLNDRGLPKNTFVDTVQLERQPSMMIYVPASGPDGRDLLYISSFSDSVIRIIDARTLVTAGKIEAFERGPFALAFARAARGPMVLATYFNDDALLAIDVSSPNPSEHRVYARVGSTRSNKPR